MDGSFQTIQNSSTSFQYFPFWLDILVLIFGQNFSCLLLLSYFYSKNRRASNFYFLIYSQAVILCKNPCTFSLFSSAFSSSSSFFKHLAANYQTSLFFLGWLMRSSSGRSQNISTQSKWLKSSGAMLFFCIKEMSFRCAILILKLSTYYLNYFLNYLRAIDSQEEPYLVTIGEGLTEFVRLVIQIEVLYGIYLFSCAIITNILLFLQLQSHSSNAMCDLSLSKITCLYSLLAISYNNICLY